MSVNYDCKGHRWRLVSESIVTEGVKRVFKCIDCLYVYEQITVKQHKNTK